jgi:signal transduction histidine kinase
MKKLNNFTILIVEDDKDMQNYIKSFLEDDVKELYQAFDSKEALKIFESKRPDILITDFSLPFFDGIELSSKIKEINKNQDIILISAFQEIDILIRAINIGINNFLPKPIYDIDKLFNILENIALNLQNKIDKKELENKLKEKEKRIAHLNNIKSLSKLSNNIAHHWRQPLSLISTISTGMIIQKKHNLLDDNRLEDMCNQINEISQSLSKHIEEFINFNITNEKEEVVNLYNIINNSISKFDTSNINVDINIDKNITIKCIKSLFIKSIQNIIQNSIDKFVQKNIENNSIIISAIKNNHKINIEILDNGGNIEETFINQVFEPYFSTKHKKNGVGLGLSMVHDFIVNRSNGEITINNKNDGVLVNIIL